MLSRDDFDWSRYTTHYAAELANGVEPYHTARLEHIAWTLEGGEVRLPKDARQLHPAHHLIYDTVLRLRPSSVFEVGYGAGDHLANLKVLLPTIRVGGADISEAQRSLALTRNPRQLSGATLLLRDLTRTDAVRGLRDAAELVFTNAVVMHIRGRDRYLTFLKNMLTISRRYILLRERWDTHNYVRDLTALCGAPPYLLQSSRATGLLVDKLRTVDLPAVISDGEIREIERAMEMSAHATTDH